MPPLRVNEMQKGYYVGGYKFVEFELVAEDVLGDPFGQDDDAFKPSPTLDEDPFDFESLDDDPFQGRIVLSVD